MPHSRLGKTPNRPPLTIDQILAWSNDFFAAHGCWPNVNSGMIPGTIDDTWRRNGYRGLPAKPKRSLARLLEMRRGVRNSEKPPPLTTSQIVKWAKQHRRRTGRWPALSRGPIEGVPGKSWNYVDLTLRRGTRGLRGGSSRAQLLARRCDARNPARPPKLTIAKILRWTDVAGQVA